MGEATREERNAELRNVRDDLSPEEEGNCILGLLQELRFPSRCSRTLNEPCGDINGAW